MNQGSSCQSTNRFEQYAAGVEWKMWRTMKWKVHQQWLRFSQNGVTPAERTIALGNLLRSNNKMGLLENDDGVKQLCAWRKKKLHNSSSHQLGKGNHWTFRLTHDFIVHNWCLCCWICFVSGCHVMIFDNSKQESRDQPTNGKLS